MTKKTTKTTKTTKKTTKATKRTTTAKLINVTATDIKKGSRGNGKECPVARAIARVFGPDIGVGATSVFVYKGTKPHYPSLEAELPKNVQEFIMNFDGGKKVKPFSFKLSLK